MGISLTTQTNHGKSIAPQLSPKTFSFKHNIMGSRYISLTEWKQTQDISIIWFFTFLPKRKSWPKSLGESGRRQAGHLREAYSGSSQVWSQEVGGMSLGWVRDCGPLTITKQHDSRTQQPAHDSSDGEDPFFQMIYVGEYTRKVCILWKKDIWAILKWHW